MNKIKRALSVIPELLLWLMISAFFWSWIFTFLTDTDVKHKVTLFTDTPACADVALAAKLEEALPHGLRMVKVHPFSYAMLDGDQLRLADLYIVPESDIATYLEWFAPLPQVFVTDDAYALDGVAYGCKVYDAQTGRGAAAEYVTYAHPDSEPQDFYLLFGAASTHLTNVPGAVDDAAEDIATHLLTLP